MDFNLKQNFYLEKIKVADVIEDRHISTVNKVCIIEYNTSKVKINLDYSKSSKMTLHKIYD